MVRNGFKKMCSPCDVLKIQALQLFNINNLRALNASNLAITIQGPKTGKCLMFNFDNVIMIMYISEPYNYYKDN